MGRKNSKFLACVGARVGPSALASIEYEEVVVTEVDPNAFPEFKMANEETYHVLTLNHWEKKALKQAEDNYFIFSRIIRKNLATTYGILLSLCDDSLRNRMGVESDFQEMTRNKRCCVMKLHHLVKKTWNGST